MPPLNVLYLHSHDTGRCVSPYGYAAPTPAIQRLADQGVLFRQAFCAAPTCSPSRAALLTGQWPHQSGMIGLAHRGFRLSDSSRHLAHYLADHGYHTALAGVQHEARDPATLGYREVLTTASPRAGDVAPVAAAWLRRAPPQPFFLSVGSFETHREFPQVAADAGRCVRPPEGLPDVPETRGDMAGFLASARRLDEGCGTVLAALDAAGLAEDTLVICTTDHGIAFPGAKCTLTDRGIGVMLILRGPAPLAQGFVCDALVSQVDLFPTICDLAGLPAPPWLQGRSLLPVLSGQRAQVRDALYAEVTYHAAYEPQRAARTDRWKYIRRFGERRHPVLPNCDDSPSKSWLLERGWAERELPMEALFDLALDPNEANNLAHDPALATTLNQMRGLLHDWMRDTDDPLLAGDTVPAPAGAEVNDPDGLSPQEPTRLVS